MSKILRYRRVTEKTGLSRSTIYLNMKKGEFPKQVTLGPNSVGWLEEDVDAWIASKVNGKVYSPTNCSKYS